MQDLTVHEINVMHPYIRDGKLWWEWGPQKIGTYHEGPQRLKGLSTHIHTFGGTKWHFVAPPTMQVKHFSSPLLTAETAVSWAPDWVPKNIIILFLFLWKLIRGLPVAHPWFISTRSWQLRWLSQKNNDRCDNKVHPNRSVSKERTRQLFKWAGGIIHFAWPLSCVFLLLMHSLSCSGAQVSGLRLYGSFHIWDGD